MRVVQVPSLALTLFDVPACCCRAQARHIVEPAARQLGGLDTGVRQVQVIRDASLTVPACWQAGWMLVRVRHRPHAAGFDCARLFAGALSTGSIAVHTTRRWYAVAGCRAFRPVKPLGLTVIGPPGPIARLSVRPSGRTITQVLGPWRRGVEASRRRSVAASQRCRRR